ncbi:MAG: two-component system response regulator [Opitutus sp.]|nr:two-component system response regulator [Opitutus sp.]
MSAPVPCARILLVEDADDDVYFFQRALKLSGVPAKLTHVGDGGAAVEHLRRALAGEIELPDLVFLDIKLPIVTGLEVLQWMQTQAFQPRPAVAILSGSEQSADIEQAMAIGVSAYFVKPVLAHQLRTRITDHLAQRAAEAATQGEA